MRLAEAGSQLVVLELRYGGEQDDGGGERGPRDDVVGDERHGGESDQQLAVPRVTADGVDAGGDEAPAHAVWLELAAPAAGGAQVHLPPPRQLEPHRTDGEDRREGQCSRRRRAEVAAEGTHHRRPDGLGDEDAEHADDRGGVEGDGGTGSEPPPQADEGVEGEPVGQDAEGEGDGEEAEPVAQGVGMRKRHRYGLGSPRDRDGDRESRAKEERVGG